MFVSIVWLLLADVLWICISALHSRSGSSLPGNSTNSKNHDDEVCVFVKRSVRGAPRFTVQTLRRRCLLFWRSFSRRKRLVMQKQILIKRAQRHSQISNAMITWKLEMFKRRRGANDIEDALKIENAQLRHEDAVKHARIQILQGEKIQLLLHVSELERRLQSME
eukprot:3933805-Rhodomonas_salina.1